MVPSYVRTRVFLKGRLSFFVLLAFVILTSAIIVVPSLLGDYLGPRDEAQSSGRAEKVQPASEGA